MRRFSSPRDAARDCNVAAMIQIAPPADSVSHMLPLTDVAQDVVGLRVFIVNAYFVGHARDWALVDAGLR